MSAQSPTQLPRFQSDKAADLSVSLRQLIAFVHREGGLSPVTYGDMSGAEGTRVHQAYFRKIERGCQSFKAGKNPDSPYACREFHSELSLSTDFSVDGFTLRVQGRADLLLQRPDGPLIIEVKSVGIPLAELSGRGETLHWAQARGYAYLYMAQQLKNELALISAEAEASDSAALRRSFARRECSYALDYVSSSDLGAQHMERRESFAALEEWFELICFRYMDFARDFKAYIERRDDGIRRLRFPYARLRDGQKEFMRQVMRNLRSRTPLLVQAPTGTGKTMSTLYPAVKALGAHLIDRIFYLTAKTSTRMVAEKALEDLVGDGTAAAPDGTAPAEAAAPSSTALPESAHGRDHIPLPLRRLTLTAKEKICLAPELYCDKRVCPFATTYYSHLREGLAELLPHFFIDHSLLRNIGRKHKLCPFELSLDAALYADIVICDYNHAFDPRVRLNRFFNLSAAHNALLVDEAHNLPDRVREMYSADLMFSELKKCRKALDAQKIPVPSALDGLERYFLSLEDGIRANKCAFDELESEIETPSVMQTENFRAVRTLGKNLLKWLRGLTFQLRPRLDEMDDIVCRRAVLDFYFSALFFLRVADEFYSPCYVFCAQRGGAELTLRLLCLDVSDRLIQLYRNQHAAIFFSATLSPLSYFSAVFCGSARDDRPDTLVLPSPFPPDHLMVLVYEAVKTTYQVREATRTAIAKLIANCLLRRPGHYLLYFPSYAYLESVVPLLKTIFRDKPVELMIQQRQMSEARRRAFITRFARRERASAAAEPLKSLLGVAVLGGVFGEGIDLTGEQLNGVIIVGTGLPQISPERELIKGYFDEVNQAGYQYAYQFPGFNKIMQAAGRLIRSETDKGLILLLDERYARPDYRELFPEEWEPTYVDTLEDFTQNLALAPNYDAFKIEPQNHDTQ